MKTSKYSDSAIMGILRQGQAGTPVPVLCRQHGMSSATYYKWRSKYSGMDASEAKRLRQLELENGKPAVIRSDNGPEYISQEMRDWADRRGIVLWFIQPGNPQQNAYVERFNRTMRYELFNPSVFDTIEEVQLAATQWQYIYNHDRPHMALNGQTPAQKLQAYISIQQSSTLH
jgi:putative transposase